MPSAQMIPSAVSAADWIIADPGDGNALQADRTGTIFLTSVTGNETRTLADPARTGLNLTMCLQTDGATDLTVTVATAYDETGSTTLLFDDAGEYVRLEAVATSTTQFVWRIVAYDGVTGPTTIIDDVTMDTLTATTATITTAGITTANITTGNITTGNVSGDLTMTDGGVVTQTGSTTTTVVVNAHSGQITTLAGTLAAAGEEAFTVTNSAVGALDAVIVSLAITSSTGTPVAICSRVAAGSFQITVTNLHTSAALNALLVINFVVIGGAAS